MASSTKTGLVLFLAILVAGTVLTSAKSIGQPEKMNYPPEFDVVEDDGSMDNALLNYLFARQMMRRIRNNMDVNDLQRKRSYFKQCAFNAVSCFGKK